MDLAVFPVGSTNIFPLTNSTRGGQLLTEYNLKSHGSVASDSSVKYNIGLSFAHSEDDFKVSPQTDGSGVVVSTSCLEIAPGKAVVDGHYVESLVPIVIDIAKINATLVLNKMTPLAGELCVGLRIMYSTEQTMAGAMLAEGGDDLYEGVRLVIQKKEEFFLPKDAPSQPDKVTAHLKLAEVIYRNGTVSAKTIFNNYPGKCQIFTAERVGNADLMLSEVYLKKTGLNPGDLYTFAGKGTDGKLDTWCKSNDTLMIWDKNPQRGATRPVIEEAIFLPDTDGRVKLFLPHKQVDGYTNLAGERTYFQPKVYALPLADYSSGTSGTVDKAYTDRIKSIEGQLENIYRMPNGKQVGFLPSLVAPRSTNLPPINPSWTVGDYIVVRNDTTMETSVEGVASPSTIYVVLPGQVRSVQFVGYSDSRTGHGLTGMELSFDEWRGTSGTPNSDDPEVFNEYWSWDSDYRGIPNQDYFTIRFYEYDEDGNESIKYAFYTPLDTANRSFSDPISLTGGIPLAQENVIGGFLNTPEELIDQGYIRRTDTGHLQLMDYALLRSGTLAYQLGQDVTIPAGLTTEEVQAMLDEYVNERIAFPNGTHLLSGGYKNVINVTITLSEEEAPTTLNIFHIDSRFDTAIYLHINGNANSNTVININECEKIRIDSNIGGSPVINVNRSCLYYDAEVFDYVNSFSDLSMWYHKFLETEPDLTIDGMTVRAVKAPTVAEDIDYWSTDVPNDNHFMYALHSLTFGANGAVIGCSLYVKNESSYNVSLDKEITVSSFTLPQGAELRYPNKRLTKQIKVSGSFMTCYYSTADNGYITTNTCFTALTNAYDGYSPSGDDTPGTISFFTDSSFIRVVNGIDVQTGATIDGWESGSFHVFYGGTIA